MGTYYHFAVVHDRVLIWWTDESGHQRVRWIEGKPADKFIDFVSLQDCKVQGHIRALLEDGR